MLSGRYGITVVADGPQPDPPQHHYKYHLTPPSNQDLWATKGEIWETDVHVRSKLNGDKVDPIAAPKIVAKLLKAWLKSAKKAGVKTADKVQ